MKTRPAANTSSSKILTQLPGIANNVVETGGALALGTAIVATELSLPKHDPARMNRLPWLCQYYALYAMTKGFFQIIEGLSIAYGKEDNVKRGWMQIAGGFLAIAAGMAYEITGNTSIPLDWALLLNAVIRSITIGKRGTDWVHTLSDETKLEKKPKEQLNMSQSPIGYNEFQYGQCANISEAFGFVLPLGDIYLATMGLFAKSMFSIPATYEKINRAMTPDQTTPAPAQQPLR